MHSAFPVTRVKPQGTAWVPRPLGVGRCPPSPDSSGGSERWAPGQNLQDPQASAESPPGLGALAWEAGSVDRTAATTSGEWESSQERAGGSREIGAEEAETVRLQ